MTQRFDPRRGPIEVLAEVSGPLGPAYLRLILDTGATQSLVRDRVLASIGYDPASSTDRVQVAMGNGVELVPRVVVNRFTAFGLHRIGFPLLAKPCRPRPASMACSASTSSEATS